MCLASCSLTSNLGFWEKFVEREKILGSRNGTALRTDWRLQNSCLKQKLDTRIVVGPREGMKVESV